MGVGYPDLPRSATNRSDPWRPLRSLSEGFEDQLRTSIHAIAGAVVALSASILAGFALVEGETPKGFALPVLIAAFVIASIIWWLARERGRNALTAQATAKTSGNHSPAQSIAHSGEGDINLDLDGGRRDEVGGGD